jgi:hypothetical protein
MTGLKEAAPLVGLVGLGGPAALVAGAGRAPLGAVLARGGGQAAAALRRRGSRDSDMTSPANIKRPADTVTTSPAATA